MPAKKTPTASTVGTKPVNKAIDENETARDREKRLRVETIEARSPIADAIAAILDQHFTDFYPVDVEAEGRETPEEKAEREAANLRARRGAYNLIMRDSDDILRNDVASAFQKIAKERCEK